MRLTSFTDFALRALMRLAGEPARSFATSEIAAEFGISRNHLAKVVRDLADGGFISTQRGAGGGFILARPPQSITLGEVVRAHPKILTFPEPQMVLLRFGPIGLDFEVRGFVAQVFDGAFVASDMRVAIVKAFSEANVSIAQAVVPISTLQP